MFCVKKFKPIPMDASLREKLATDLTAWYYADGNGMFLSMKAKIYFCKDYLNTSERPSSRSIAEKKRSGLQRIVRTCADGGSFAIFSFLGNPKFVRRNFQFKSTEGGKGMMQSEDGGVVSMEEVRRRHQRFVAFCCCFCWSFWPAGPAWPRFGLPVCLAPKAP
jgi:hypothetical protein